MKHAKEIGALLCLAVAAGLAAVVLRSGAGDKPGVRSAGLRVTCTTTLLSAAAAAVGSEDVEVHTVVPCGMCPGHFDLTPGDAGALRDSDVILYHGFEKFMDGLDADARGRAVRAGVHGNWMIPSVHTQAVWRIAGILSGKMPDAAGPMECRAAEYVGLVDATGRSALERLEKYRGMPVICSVLNSDLARWCGFDVAAEFGRDEDVSVKALHDVITIGRAAGARLAIDNRQSSGKIGRTVAGELGIPLAVLSNFPPAPSCPGVYPYIEALIGNADEICARLNCAEAGKTEN